MDIPKTIKLCRESDLKKARQITQWIDAWADELSAIYDNQEITIVSSVCPHFGGELELVSDRKKVRCNWHHWEFDLDSGKCLTFPISACLRRYPYRIVDGFIEVSLP